MAETQKNATLSDAVKDKYKMKTGFAPGKYSFRGKDINLTTCSLEDLDYFVKTGFNIVVPIPAPQTETKK